MVKHGQTTLGSCGTLSLRRLEELGDNPDAVHLGLVRTIHEEAPVVAQALHLQAARRREEAQSDSCFSEIHRLVKT